MHIEHRKAAPKTTALANDLAHHLYTRFAAGNAIIFTSEPLILLRVTRKQWLKLLYAVRRERSKTLHTERIQILSQQLTAMQEIRFVLAHSAPDKAPVFCFLRPPTADKTPPRIYRTAYIMPDAPGLDTTAPTRFLTDDGLLVRYTQS